MTTLNLAVKHRHAKPLPIPAHSTHKYAVACVQHDRHGRAIHDRRLSRYFATKVEAWREAQKLKYQAFGRVYVIEIVRHWGTSSHEI
ncbi:MAG: hypothetical protein R3F53_05330 [Gammaproteobacteria bacterium]